MRRMAVCRSGATGYRPDDRGHQQGNAVADRGSRAGLHRPTFSGQIGLSYFQAGRICDYINGRWGWGTLMAMMRSFGELEETPQVIREHLGMEPEEFDRQFFAWLNGKMEPMLEGYDDWQEQIKALR